MASCESKLNSVKDFATVKEIKIWRALKQRYSFDVLDMSWLTEHASDLEWSIQIKGEQVSEKGWSMERNVAERGQSREQAKSATPATAAAADILLF